MNRINRKVEYALMALKLMSQKVPGELSTAKEVCETLHTPFDATARVMQIMAQKNLLRSEQGAQGGYQITRDLSKISLQELLEMIEGPQALVKCMHREGDEESEMVCEIQKTCTIASPLSALSHRINDFFRQVTLKELLLESQNGRESQHGRE